MQIKNSGERYIPELKIKDGSYSGSKKINTSNDALDELVSTLRLPNKQRSSRLFAHKQVIQPVPLNLQSKVAIALRKSNNQVLNQHQRNSLNTTDLA